MSIKEKLALMAEMKRQNDKRVQEFLMAQKQG